MGTDFKLNIEVGGDKDYYRKVLALDIIQNMNILRQSAEIHERVARFLAEVKGWPRYVTKLHGKVLNPREVVASLTERNLVWLQQHAHKQLQLIRQCRHEPCGVWFLARRGDQEYCRKEHQKAAWDRANKAEYMRNRRNKAKADKAKSARR